MLSRIFLSDGNKIFVTNISKVIRHTSSSSQDVIFEAADFEEFTFDRGNYTFVGDNTVALHGSDILYVTFEPNN